MFQKTLLRNTRSKSLSLVCNVSIINFRVTHDISSDECYRIIFQKWNLSMFIPYLVLIILRNRRFSVIYVQLLDNTISLEKAFLWNCSIHIPIKCYWSTFEVIRIQTEIKYKKSSNLKKLMRNKWGRKGRSDRWLVSTKIFYWQITCVSFLFRQLFLESNCCCIGVYCSV